MEFELKLMIDEKSQKCVSLYITQQGEDEDKSSTLTEDVMTDLKKVAHNIRLIEEIKNFCEPKPKRDEAVEFIKEKGLHHSNAAINCICVWLS